MGREACYKKLIKSIYFYSDRALRENEKEKLAETKQKAETMMIDNIN